MRKNSVVFPLREGTFAGARGKLEIPKQGELCFFSSALPVLLAMKNGRTQWSHFPTLSWERTYEGAPIDGISFVGSQGHLLPSQD